MRKFELYYNQYLIGNIQINDNSFLYIPNNEVIKQLNEEIILEFLKEEINFFHPFFESRIKNMDKFDLKNLKYINSGYEIKEVF